MDNLNFRSGYSEVNGISMYYERYGNGKPLVLIHGGGSTIQISFGKIIPRLAQNRQIIAMDLEAHGRTNSRNTPLTFEQDADDVAQLLHNLGIGKADFLGFSNGGNTVMEIALRHPQLVGKLILCSSLYKRNGTFPQFWEGFDHASFDQLPQPFKEEFLRVNNNPDALLNMFNKDVARMKAFQDWTDGQLASIQAPAYIINGTEDVATPEHAVAMYRLFPNGELTILPSNHGEYIGQIDPQAGESALPGITIGLIEKFLDK